MTQVFSKRMQVHSYWYFLIYFIIPLECSHRHNTVQHFNFARPNFCDFTVLGHLRALNFREFWLEEFLSFKMSPCLSKLDE